MYQVKNEWKALTFEKCNYDDGNITNHYNHMSNIQLEFFSMTSDQPASGNIENVSPCWNLES